MSKTNVIKNTQYSAMPLEHLKDNRLSLQAKGLMSEMIVDDKTEFTLKELFKFGSEEEILVSIAELGNYGYITKLNVG